MSLASSYVPAAHSAHAVKASSGADPSPQSAHTLLPPPLAYVSVPHAAHAAPSLLHWPGGHATHPSRPSPLASWPSGHAAHAVLPGASATSGSLGCCARHDVHSATDATAPLANVPTGHLPHADLSSLTNSPATHSSHALSVP